MLPTVKIGNRTFTILFPEIMRPLTKDERQTLKNSIRELGVTAPVIVDEEDGVIDGFNRLEIAAEVGLKGVPVHVKPSLSDTEKAKLAISLNDARRHLKPAEQEEIRKDRKERIARALKKRTQGMSLRAIAETEGVSKTQVEKDIKDVTVQGWTVEQPEKVKGRDGRTVKAKKKPQKPGAPMIAPQAASAPTASQPAPIYHRNSIISLLNDGGWMNTKHLPSKLDGTPSFTQVSRTLDAIADDPPTGYALHRRKSDDFDQVRLVPLPEDVLAVRPLDLVLFKDALAVALKDFKGFIRHSKTSLVHALSSGTLDEIHSRIKKAVEILFPKIED